MNTQRNLDAKAKRAAKRIGLVAVKSLCLRGTPNNLGGFYLKHEPSKTLIAGEYCELTAEEVIARCTLQRG